MHYLKVQESPEGGQDFFIFNANGSMVYKGTSLAAVERKMNILNGGLGLAPHEYFAAQAMAGLAAGGGYAGNPAGLAEDALAVGTYMVDMMNRQMKKHRQNQANGKQ